MSAEPELEILPGDEEPSYPLNTTVEEQRRAFIFAHLASPEIDIAIIIKGCKLAEPYLETGATPEPPKRLRAVP